MRFPRPPFLQKGPPDADPEITLWMGIAGLIATLPFTVSHFLRQEWLLTLFIGLANLSLGAVIFSIWRWQRIPVRLAFGLISAICATHIFCLPELQNTGIYWSYPLICATYFILGSRRAGWLIGVYCPILLLVAYRWAEPVTFTRITMTMLLTWLFAIVFSVSSERQRAALQHAAASDPLTGAANRREMEAELMRAKTQHDRYGVKVSLLLMDLDHFKKVNDTHGHGVGDQVLIEFVALIQQRLRTGDRLFRVGGEEFLVLLPQTRAREAEGVAEMLRRLVEEASLAKMNGLTVSLGISELQKGDSVAQWLDRADQALYRAKALGRNRWEPGRSVLPETVT